MPADLLDRPPVTTVAAADRILIRHVLYRAHRDGWVIRWSDKRRDGLWSWCSVDWPRFARPPAKAQRVTWDGRTLAVQRVSDDPVGWDTVLWGRPRSVRQAVWMLVAAGVLPEAVTR
ncbi:hypothetical protein O7626_39775 [Micromonospora sp. WMMD1102]|uniref:hypothetical protein n=1 Tax=Micromonospora sp. WMMD1102 TaxID=3016105 RepID=UPI00241511AC|nr:hypothetical protein [Micromonospora sp. WMMD1102]MDG4791955.1 hypothetical protein [Micromonospora sp. WMMD1102]